MAKSICAGMCISIGCIAYMISSSPFIGSILFSVGLLSIVIHGFKLFTGTISSVNINTLRYNIKILVGNLIGVVIASILFFGTGIDTTVYNLVYTKLSASIIEVFCKAAFCNILICIAVDEWKNTHNSILVILSVVVFILCGFEHCVANAFYMLVSGQFSLIFLAINILGNAFGGILLWRLKHLL